MLIYLVVKFDRHEDENYTAHTTMEEAEQEADNFMDSYGSQYQWENQTTDSSWYYYHTTDIEEGPTVYIEELELEVS